jgi:hypothetical protein
LAERERILEKLNNLDASIGNKNGEREEIDEGTGGKGMATLNGAAASNEYAKREEGEMPLGIFIFILHAGLQNPFTVNHFPPLIIPCLTIFLPLHFITFNHPPENIPMLPTNNNIIIPLIIIIMEAMAMDMEEEEDIITRHPIIRVEDTVAECPGEDTAVLAISSIWALDGVSIWVCPHLALESVLAVDWV